jgi:large-conductance mechanosensitive channel
MKTIIIAFCIFSLILAIGVISDGVAKQMTSDNDKEKNEPK